LDLFPDNVDYNFKYAQAALIQDDVETSINHYKKVITLHDESGDTADKTEQSFLALGQIYEEKLKDKKRAIRVYKKLLQKYPENDLARANFNRLTSN
jgi:tetratricopeptide (TPR) repeat protein